VIFRLAGRRAPVDIASFASVRLLVIAETTQQGLLEADNSVTGATQGLEGMAPIKHALLERHGGISIFPLPPAADRGREPLAGDGANDNSPSRSSVGAGETMAGREGFEPSRPVSRPTIFPGSLIKPLSHLPAGVRLAERVGFEPTCGLLR
jgi:hypothetical protein